MTPLARTIRLELDGGGAAEVRDAAGEQARLRSSRAFPPGATLAGSEVEGGLSGWRLKVRSCRQVEAGAALPFQVEGRWVNLSRVQRERLVGPT